MWGAYSVLHNSRSLSECGPGAIPLSEIKAYLDIMYITDVERRLYFIRMIKSLDLMYLSDYQQKLERKQAQQAKR